MSGYSMIDLLLEHGDIQEAHDLLFQENVEGRNAYYEQKTHIDDLYIYQRDIGKVWRIAEQEVQVRLASGANAGVPLGILCRYPLIIASLNDWLRSIDPVLVIELVEAGVKPPMWGKFTADLAEDPTDKFEILGALWGHFPEDVQGEVLKEIEHAFPALSASDELIHVIETFPPKLLLNLVDRIRSISIPEDWRGNRARALAALLPHLPKNKRADILQECLDSARAIPNSLGHSVSLAMALPFISPKKRNEILEECIGCLSAGALGSDLSFLIRGEGNFLQRLAEYVNPEMFEVLLTLEKDEYMRDHYRDNLYSAICSYLAERNLFLRLWVYFSAIKNDDVRTTTLVHMLPLPVKWLSLLLIPPQTLSNLTVKQVLGAVRKRITARSEYKESQLYSILLRRVRDVEKASDVVSALIDLLPYLTISEQEEVLGEIRTLIGQEDRANKIGFLIHLSHRVPPSQRATFLEEALSLVKKEDDAALLVLDLVCAVLLRKTASLRDHPEKLLMNHLNEGKYCPFVLIDQLPRDWLAMNWEIIQASSRPDPFLRGKCLSRMIELGEIETARNYIISLLPELVTSDLVPFLCSLPPSAINEDVLPHLIEKIVSIQDIREASEICRVFDMDCVTDQLSESSVDALVAWSKALSGGEEMSAGVASSTLSDLMSRLLPCYARLGRIEEAYQIVQTLDNYSDKARSLAGIAQHVGGSLREKYVREINEYLAMEKDPNNMPEYFKLFTQAFGAMRGSVSSSAIEMTPDAKTLALMAKLLPMEERIQYWEEVALEHEFQRAEVLIPLVPEMPMSVVQRTLNVLANEKTYGSKIPQAALLTTLIRRLKELVAQKRFEMLSSYLLDCSRQGREKLVLDLSAWATLISDLGGTEALVLLQQAAHSVYRWWDQRETRGSESGGTAAQESEVTQEQATQLREDSASIEQVEPDIVEDSSELVPEAILTFVKRAKDGPVSEKVMNDALHTLASLSKMPDGEQKNRSMLALQVYQDAHAAFNWFSDHLYGYRLGLYGYSLRSSVRELMFRRLPELLEKSGFESRSASRIAACRGIRRWLEGYLLAMLFMELKRRGRLYEINDDLLGLFLFYDSDLVQEEFILADAAGQFYVGRTAAEAINLFLHPADSKEVTKERKEQIQRKILEIIIDALERNLLETEELPLIGDFVLKKMEGITSEPELFLFFSVLERKWKIFHDVENFEPVETKEHWMTVGMERYHAGSYDEALNAFEQAIHLDPDYAFAYQMKGGALVELKRYEEALAAYEEVLRFDPANATAFYNKALILYRLQLFEEAIPAFDNSILYNPNYALVYVNKSAALLALRRNDEVLAACDQAIRLDPNIAEVYNNKGAALKDLGLYTEAIAAFEQAIRINPNSVIAYYNKGLTLEDLQRYSEAIAAFDSAIVHDPKYAQAYFSKSRALLQLQRYDDALENLEQLIDLDPTDPSRYYYKGLVLVELKRYEEALAAYERVIHLNPDDALTYNNIGDALLQLGRYEEALTACDQAIRLDPDLAIAYHTQGETLLALQRYNEALIACEQAICLDPTNDCLYDDRGAALEHLGRPKEAQQAYIKAEQLRGSQ